MKKKELGIITVIIVISLGLIILGLFLLNKKEVVIVRKNAINYGKLYENQENPDREQIEKHKDVIIKDYATYREIIGYYGKNTQLKKEDFKNYEYLVVLAEMEYCDGKVNGIRGINSESKSIKLKIGIDKACEECPIDYYLYLIPFEKNTLPTNYHVEYEYITENSMECQLNK